MLDLLEQTVDVSMVEFDVSSSSLDFYCVEDREELQLSHDNLIQDCMQENAKVIVRIKK